MYCKSGKDREQKISDFLVGNSQTGDRIIYLSNQANIRDFFVRNEKFIIGAEFSDELKENIN